MHLGTGMSCGVIDRNTLVGRLTEMCVSGSTRSMPVLSFWDQSYRGGRFESVHAGSVWLQTSIRVDR